MDNKKLLNSITIKQEPNTSTAKKILLSSSSFGSLSTKNVTNARLPSFKPPRDLFLTGSVTGNSNSAFSVNSNNKGTRRTFVPNINVTRKKGSAEAVPSLSVSEPNSKGKDRDKNKKAPFNRKRNANVVQTKGVFSEGLAPGKVKAFGNASAERAYNERQILEKPKLNLNKTIKKTEEDSKLKSILKDDFIDDPSQVPDTNFIPSSLPMVYNVKSLEKSGDLEKTFETLQIKTEKASNINGNEKKDVKPVIGPHFESSQSPKMFLFEFPTLIKQQNEVTVKKKSVKGQNVETDNDSERVDNLSSLGEGLFGYLRIHKNGKAFLVIGKTTIPLCINRHDTRQEVMSASIDGDSQKGEVINLGTIDASFSCSANFFQGVPG